MKSDANSDTVGSRVIYLDNSLSLQRTDQAGNLLLLNALNAAEGLVTGFPREGDVGLITNDRSIVHLLPAAKALEELQEVEYSKNSVPLNTIYERIKRIQGEEFLIFSDMQRSTILPLDELLQDTTFKTSFYLLNSPVEQNLYIDTVYLEKPLGIRTQNVLSIGVKNTGSERVNDALLKVYKGDQQLSSFTVNIPSESVETVFLEVGLNAPVVGNYKIELDDTPVVFDNTYFFSINATDRPVVVILSDNSTNPYLENVYSNEEYFHFISTSVNNSSFQDISRADLLILDQLETIPDWLLSQLNGLEGDIFVIPAENISSESYISLLGFPIQKRKSASTTQLSPESLEGPFLEGVFNKRNERMSMPHASIKYDLSGYFNPLIETVNNHPFLVRAGKDNIYFVSTPLLDSNTNFQKHALFVPVMYKLAQNRNTTRLSYRLDEPNIVIAVDSLTTEVIVKLTNGSNSFIPSSRFIDDDLILELPDVLNDPGIYYALAGNDTLASVALNYNKRESEIASISPEEFRSIISGYDHIRLEEIADVQGFINDRNSASEHDSLWKYALFLALFFIIAELLLLRFI